MEKPIFNIDSVCKSLPFDTYKVNTYYMDMVYSMYHGGTLILDFDVLLSDGEPLQRGIEWDLHRRQSFILSILSNYGQDDNSEKLGGFSLVKSGIRRKTAAGELVDVQEWLVIDGKQRLTTLLDFMDNKFPVVVNGHEYLFKELNGCEGLINRVSFRADYTLASDIPADKRDEYLAQWFYRLNSTYAPQKDAHMERVKQYLPQGHGTNV